MTDRTELLELTRILTKGRVAGKEIKTAQTTIGRYGWMGLGYGRMVRWTAATGVLGIKGDNFKIADARIGAGGPSLNGEICIFADVRKNDTLPPFYLTSEYCRLSCEYGSSAGQDEQCDGSDTQLQAGPSGGHDLVAQ